jgi:hypothetical protein
MQDILVLDNFIELPYQEHLASMLLGVGSAVSWVYLPSTVGDTDKWARLKTQQTVDTPQMIHNFFNPRYTADNAALDGLILPLKFKLEAELNQRFDIVRIKANLLFRDHTSSDNTGMPHSDNNTPGCISMVYYVSSSDGDTVIFNEFDQDNVSELTVAKRVEPKQGRVVVFDSNRIHCSTNPIINQTRCVLNFVLKPL